LLSRPQDLPELPHDEGARIELVEDQHYYAKMEVRGLLSPLTFKMYCEPRAGGGPQVNDVEVYLSTFDLRPSSNSCELKFFGASCFKVPANRIGRTNPALLAATSPLSSPTSQGPRLDDETPMFRDKYLYLSFLSRSGRSVSVHFHQGEKKSNRALQEVREMQERRRREYENIESVFTVQDQYYREMLHMVAQKVVSAEEFKHIQKEQPNKYIYG